MHDGRTPMPAAVSAAAIRSRSATVAAAVARISSRFSSAISASAAEVDEIPAGSRIASIWAASASGARM